jgi:hypothetical protein
LVVRVVDELHDTASIGDECWGLMQDLWRPDQLVELVTLVGQYHAVSFVANAFGVDHEAFAARFPAH